MKSKRSRVVLPQPGRSPCGERGLKCVGLPALVSGPKSLPVRGAWVEIFCRVARRLDLGSLPVRGAWVEMVTWVSTDERRMSLPVRGAWVEMCFGAKNARKRGVAPRAGSVG